MEGNSLCSRAAVYFMISFRQLCLLTVSLPLCALLFCFVTAYIFQQDDIHETHCRVYNVIPSISAITGISPQRYLWRICIAFHVGPRVVIASVYRTYYRQQLARNGQAGDEKAIRLLDICYWLNMLEIAALCGVTYISNRENYPIHEKIFIMFMFGSLSYMLATLKVFKLLHPDMNDQEKASYLFKKCLFVTSICCTVGLLIFFLKHRLLCHEMAFSWFSLCEYCIASANMAFHVTVVLDFPTEKLIVAQESADAATTTNTDKIVSPAGTNTDKTAALTVANTKTTTVAAIVNTETTAATIVANTDKTTATTIVNTDNTTGSANAEKNPAAINAEKKDN